MSVTQGFDSEFQYGNAPTASGSTGWTPFAQVLDIKPPKIEAKDIETSVMDSPEQYEEFVAGWANAGEMTVKVQFEKTQQATIFGLFRRSLGYRVMFNDAPSPSGVGSNLACTGYIKGIADEIDRENLVTCEVTVKLSGKPVFTPAA